MRAHSYETTKNNKSRQTKTIDFQQTIELTFCQREQRNTKRATCAGARSIAVHVALRQSQYVTRGHGSPDEKRTCTSERANAERPPDEDNCKENRAFLKKCADMHESEARLKISSAELTHMQTNLRKQATASKAASTRSPR